MGEFRVISNPTDLPVRLPTTAEFEAMWQAQQAEELMKQQKAAAGDKLARPLTDTVVELLEDTGKLPEDPGLKPSALCPECGRVFRYETKGMAMAQMLRHRKKAHPETVMVD